MGRPQATLQRPQRVSTPAGQSPPDRARTRPLVIGHRGASAYLTENTMDSFCAARDAGADGIELDVRLCASGELVVFHDEVLARMAGRGESIARMSLDALRRVRLDDERQIPTLDDVFATFAGTDFCIHVELKTTGFRGCTALILAVLACIEHHGVAEQVYLSSFDPLAIARVGLHSPRSRTGFLFHGGQLAPFRQAWFAPLLRPHAVHPHHELITPTTVAAWRRKNYAIHTWTVDSPAAQRRLAALGVDAIMTNDPAACLATLADSPSD